MYLGEPRGCGLLYCTSTIRYHPQYPRNPAVAYKSFLLRMETVQSHKPIMLLSKLFCLKRQNVPLSRPSWLPSIFATMAARVGCPPRVLRLLRLIEIATPTGYQRSVSTPPRCCGARAGQLALDRARGGSLP